MKHAEMVIARQAIEEGRGLVVIVNKMDLLRGKQNAKLYEKVMKAVPEEIQTVIPQVCQFLKFWHHSDLFHWALLRRFLILLYSDPLLHIISDK